MSFIYSIIFRVAFQFFNFKKIGFFVFLLGLLLTYIIFFTFLSEVKDEVSIRTKFLKSVPASDFINSGTPKENVDITIFYGVFPRREQLPDITSKFYKIAENHSVPLEQVSYRMTDISAEMSLIGYEIVMPVKGGYPAIRDFISQSLQELPSLSLDAISVARLNANDPMVDAELRMTLYMRPE